LKVINGDEMKNNSYFVFIIVTVAMAVIVGGAAAVSNTPKDYSILLTMVVGYLAAIHFELYKANKK